MLVTFFTREELGTASTPRDGIGRNSQRRGNRHGCVLALNRRVTARLHTYGRLLTHVDAMPAAEAHGDDRMW